MFRLVPWWLTSSEVTFVLLNSASYSEKDVAYSTWRVFYEFFSFWFYIGRQPLCILSYPDEQNCSPNCHKILTPSLILFEPDPELSIFLYGDPFVSTNTIYLNARLAVILSDWKLTPLFSSLLFSTAWSNILSSRIIRLEMIGETVRRCLSTI